MSMVQEKMYMDVDDVCAILGVSKTYTWTESEKYGKISIRNDIMKSEVGGYTHENCNH